MQHQINSGCDKKDRHRRVINGKIMEAVLPSGAIRMAGRCRPLTRWILPALSIPLLCLPSLSRAAEVNWTMEFFVGVSFHFPAPLTIRQSGRPDIRLNARYASKSLEKPIYYGWRIGNWHGDNGWELELVHNKLYLSETHEDVQVFSISHGFNLLTVNRSRERGGVVERLGAGVVITHPESTVREKRFTEEGGIFGWGYFVSGPTVQAAAGKQIRIKDDLFAPAEGKVSASFARVPVADGDADVTNFALHGIFGLGYGR